MRLVDFVPPAGILFRLAAADRVAAVAELAVALGPLGGLDPESVRTLLMEREQLGSTAIGHGIAMPHARMEVTRTVGVLGLSEQGIDWEAPDGSPVRIFVGFVSPTQGGAHLKALAAVVMELTDGAFRARLLEAHDAADVYHILSAPRIRTPM